MNIERLKTLSALFRSGGFPEGTGFGMEETEFEAECGTAMCIYGWARRFWPGEIYWLVGCDGLGLSHFQASDLFMPDDFDTPGLYAATDAANAIDHLIETGVVKWEASGRAES